MRCRSRTLGLDSVARCSIVVVFRQSSSYCKTLSKETNETTDLKEPRTDPRKELCADIKAVLVVVGRRQEDRVPEEYQVRPDFRGINLTPCASFYEGLRQREDLPTLGISSIAPNSTEVFSRG